MRRVVISIERGDRATPEGVRRPSHAGVTGAAVPTGQWGLPGRGGVLSEFSQAAGERSLPLTGAVTGGVTGDARDWSGQRCAGPGRGPAGCGGAQRRTSGRYVRPARVSPSFHDLHRARSAATTPPNSGGRHFLRWPLHRRAAARAALGPGRDF